MKQNVGEPRADFYCPLLLRVDVRERRGAHAQIGLKALTNYVRRSGEMVMRRGKGGRARKHDKESIHVVTT